MDIGDLQATYWPGGQLPSDGHMAWWSPDPLVDPDDAIRELGLPAGQLADLPTVLPASPRARKKVMAADTPARVVPIHLAVRALTALPPVTTWPGWHRPSDSVMAWSVAAKLALELTAAGQIAPRTRSGGLGTGVVYWQSAPAGDGGRLATLAASFPRAAHALLRDEDDETIWSALDMLRAFCDGVADSCIRTTAGSSGAQHRDHATSRAARWASALTGPDPIVELTEQEIDELARWSAPDADVSGQANARLCLQLHTPQTEAADEPWPVQFHLQAADDPSLMVPAGDVWSVGARSMRLLGRDVDDRRSHWSAASPRRPGCSPRSTPACPSLARSRWTCLRSRPRNCSPTVPTRWHRPDWASCSLPSSLRKARRSCGPGSGSPRRSPIPVRASRAPDSMPSNCPSSPGRQRSGTRRSPQRRSRRSSLASQVRHSAALLDGRMPEDIDDVLAGCGLSFFPRGHELDTKCSCPDAVNPCKHVAAVHYELAQTFDADPFLLPELRGRDRAALLASLRSDRVGSPAATPSSESSGPASTGTSLSELSPGELFRARGDLSAIVVHPQPAEAASATLRRLGPPPGEFAAGLDPLDAVEHAAEHAWQLAAGDADHVDDPLLEELRALGSATSRQLGEGLGWSVEAVRAHLSPLIEQGLAHRTGHARSTRYHA